MTLLWDVRTALEEAEAKKLEEIINGNTSKKSYYIFKASNWTGNDSNVLKDTYMLMSRKPPKMLGTVLWLVDNVKGSLSRIWDLPMDLNVDPTLLDSNNEQAHVADSAQGVEGAILLS